VDCCAQLTYECRLGCGGPKKGSQRKFRLGHQPYARWEYTPSEGRTERFGLPTSLGFMQKGNGEKLWENEKQGDRFRGMRPEGSRGGRANRGGRKNKTTNGRGQGPVFVWGPIKLASEKKLDAQTTEKKWCPRSGKNRKNPRAKRKNGKLFVGEKRGMVT